VFSKWIVLITSAVFLAVLIKVGLDVMDRDFLSLYFKLGWKKSLQRNLQLGIIIYPTVMTVVFDLNIAVVSAAILFYVGKRWILLQDVDSGMTEVHK
jgi:hypothetical protein